jgi:heterodisulfide reductase subunit A
MGGGLNMPAKRARPLGVQKANRAGPRKNRYVTKKRDSAEEPRIGVFVCYCGLNIAGTVDVEDVAEYARKLPNVVYVKTNRYTCADQVRKK